VFTLTQEEANKRNERTDTLQGPRPEYKEITGFTAGISAWQRATILS